MLHRLKSLHDVTVKPTYLAEMVQVDQPEVFPTQSQTAAPLCSSRQSCPPPVATNRRKDAFHTRVALP